MSISKVNYSDTFRKLTDTVNDLVDNINSQQERLDNYSDKIGILLTADDVLFQNDRSIFLEIDKYKKLRFQQGVATITGVASNGYFRFPAAGLFRDLRLGGKAGRRCRRPRRAHAPQGRLLREADRQRDFADQLHHHLIS